MSNYQLYSTNNSAWTNNLAINAIVNIQYAEQCRKSTITEELFNELVMDDYRGVSLGRCVEIIDELNQKGSNQWT